MSTANSQILIPVVTLLAAAVVSVPLLRRGGFSSVLAYFVAGLAIGPSALAWFADPHAILQISELGVVMFLFIIGLELQPQRLWQMRGDLMGVGLAQVLLATALLSVLAWALGQTPTVAFVGAAGFVLSSTAVVAQMLRERGQLHTREGQRAIAILLLEDLSVVPLMLLVAWLASQFGQPDAALPAAAHEATGWRIAYALLAIALLYAAGRWVLNPLFALLAKSGAREVLTAGALMVVLGAALLMDAVGLSMAMGAFMAGVMLSGSSYRHQVEADIEPFKGILLGLFFLAVGMSLNVTLVLSLWPTIAVLLAGFILVKGVAIYTVARVFGSGHSPALLRAALFAQGGEFGFVLYAAAQGGGLMDAATASVFSAVTILSMALSSLLIALVRRLLPVVTPSLEGTEAAQGLQGSALIIGFGRFGQIASQGLLAQGIHIATIDSDPDRIREAEKFGYKVYYGDGTRLDVLQASGAASAQVVLVCVDKRENALAIVHLLRNAFPQLVVLARAYDRRHAIEVAHAGAHWQMRETVESALQMGAEALVRLGFAPEEARQAMGNIRERDNLILEDQIARFKETEDLRMSIQPAPIEKRAARTAAMSR